MKQPNSVDCGTLKIAKKGSYLHSVLFEFFKDKVRHNFYYLYFPLNVKHVQNKCSLGIGNLARLVHFNLGQGYLLISPLILHLQTPLLQLLLMYLSLHLPFLFVQLLYFNICIIPLLPHLDLVCVGQAVGQLRPRLSLQYKKKDEPAPLLGLSTEVNRVLNSSSADLLFYIACL